MKALGFKALIGALLLSITSAANAAFIFSQNGNEITMEVINESYTLTANQTDNILYVALLDVFLPGGGSVHDGARVGGSGTMSVNGGAATALNWWGGWQYRPGFQAPWTPEDVSFLFELTPNTLSIGDTITVNATLTMNMLADADIIMPSVFGNVTTVIGGHRFLYSQGHTTDVSRQATGVSEPSVLALFGLALLGMGSIRRKANA
ncbi:PEP-CTERM sorting domain-containing protein [Aestuariibacter halophilus]|uniref:PEP-CTERM sorting domain-containing protein n=1 Tax=Fluctibacter halophilus TaxID=226011 RepID=A0ABS8G871_9ALTE|nr:PEP-CTERM sorting domain-containing protein [Aestuariibacter halophilus]MCC2616361.1 PEP-CTERM sorting domain-containing protein [Aestuariibacter halophilus]